jgi:5'-nucleotidase
MKKEKVYVDMDGVMCNFDDASSQARIDNPTQLYPQSQWGFFLKLAEIPGAVEGIRKLQEKYDVWVLTRPSFKNVNCFTEKAQWILDHYDFQLLEKTIMCGDKSLLKGEYLIDDRNTDKQSEFEGEWIEFGSYKFPDWKTVVNYLMNK